MTDNTFVLVKYVDMTFSKFDYRLVGPFDTDDAAETYADKFFEKTFIPVGTRAAMVEGTYEFEADPSGSYRAYADVIGATAP